MQHKKVAVCHILTWPTPSWSLLVILLSDGGSGSFFSQIVPSAPFIAAAVAFVLVFCLLALFCCYRLRPCARDAATMAATSDGLGELTAAEASLSLGELQGEPGGGTAAAAQQQPVQDSPAPLLNWNHPGPGTSCTCACKVYSSNSLNYCTCTGETLDPAIRAAAASAPPRRPPPSVPVGRPALRPPLPLPPPTLLTALAPVALEVDGGSLRPATYSAATSTVSAPFAAAAPTTPGWDSLGESHGDPPRSVCTQEVALQDLPRPSAPSLSAVPPNPPRPSAPPPPLPPASFTPKWCVCKW